MNIVFFLLITILGACIGSFLLVLIDRLPRGEGVIHGRSHCEFCGHVLASKDLIPILSYVLLRGKCRYCHKKLTLSYPFFEILTAALFLQASLSISQGDPSFFFLEPFQFLFLLYTLYVVSCLLLVFFIDLKEGIIPFVVVLPAILIAGIWIYFSEPFLFINVLLSALGASLFFFLCFAFTRGRGMGFGDVVFAFLLGLLLGYPLTIAALYVAFLTGAVVSLILIVSRRKKFRGSTIAFGPFLVVGLYLCYFWGDGVMSMIKAVLHI